MKSTQINNQNSVQIEPNQPSRKELNQPFKENMLENKQEFTSNPSGGGSSSPPPPPHYNEEKPKQPQQTDFMDYLDFYFKKEYKLLLKKDPAKIEEIKKYLTELEKEGQTKCLNCFQTFSREKDQDEFDECLVKNICLECQVKKEKKITGEWREFQQKLGMPVEELPKTW
jgi:hypothetical protein